MNFSPFGGHFPAVHQFASGKFGNDQIQPGTMLVTTAPDGTIQYIRPEHNGANFLTASANTNPVQGIPVSIATSTVNVPVSVATRGASTAQQHVHQQHQQLTAVVNQTAGNKYHPTGTLLGWGEVPLMHHFSEAGKNVATINVPYPNPGMNSATILAVQPTPTSGAPAVWPVKLMQSVSTMTVDESELQPQDLCKSGDGDKMKADAIKRDKDSGESEDDSDDSSKSDAEGPSSTSEPEQIQNKQIQIPLNITHPMTNGGGLECHQIQLQQQGSAMADYLARLQPPTIPLSLQQFIKYQTNNAAAAAVAAVSDVKRENEMTMAAPGSIVPIHSESESATSPKKKKKKKTVRKPPRPKPGEIRLSTALDGSTLFCCPECYMAYPDRDMLEQHLTGHKQERRFVCNVCGAGLKRKEHLDQHKRGHSDERPFVCTVCMKGFKRNEHLTRHYVIHSGNKSHTCGECGKAFSRKDHLHKHAQTHIAKRVKAELSQVANLENGAASSPVVTPPTSMTIPHVIPHHHQQPLHHPLHLHHGMSSVNTLGVYCPVYDRKSIVRSCFKTPGLWHFKIQAKSSIVHGEQNYRSDLGVFREITKKGNSVTCFLKIQLPLGVTVKQEKLQDGNKLLKNHYGEEWKDDEDLQYYKNLMDGEQTSEEETTECLCEPREEDDLRI